MPQWDLRLNVKMEGKEPQIDMRSRFPKGINEDIAEFVAGKLRAFSDYQNTAIKVSKIRIGIARPRNWLSNAVAGIGVQLKRAFGGYNQPATIKRRK